MSRNSSYRRVVLSAVASLVAITLTTSNAVADTVSYFAAGGNFCGGPVLLPNFDPSLGTLQSVTLSDGISIRSFGLSNNFPLSDVDSVTKTVDFLWASSFGDRSGTVTQTFTSADDGFYVTWDSYRVLTFNDLQWFTQGQGPGFQDAYYIGYTPSVELVGYRHDESGNSIEVYRGGGNPNYYLFQWTATVTYTYTTPEPSTLVLLGIGAVSVLAYGWKRRRTA
jgi:hypothetical protein